MLSDAAGRQHLLHRNEPDWVAFFDAGVHDPAIDETSALLHLLDPSLAICLLTARPARVRPITEDWLHRYALRWDVLVMRPDDFRGLSSDYKRASVHDLRAYGFDLRLAFEDDPRNVAMFRSEGIACVYIHSGYYG